MKRNSKFSGRFALTGVACAALVLVASDSWALGLGRLTVQSALGESIRAEIDVTSLTPEEASSLRIRIAPPEAYRAAGVDYNPVLPGSSAVIQKRSDGRQFLRISSDRAVQEPFVDVILELTWSTGRLVREYTLLFDPPTSVRSPAAAAAIASAAAATSPPVAVAPPPITAPVMSAAPPAPPPTPSELAAATAKPSRPPVVAKAPMPEPAAPVEPRLAARDAEPGADEYRVKSGDSLSRIASRTQRPGVSLDQMLVSLYRANPQAFVEQNMNRLRSGVVLAVPSADTAKSVSVSEAKQVIQAQSADFGAFRQRLAGAVPEARAEGNARQASGKVEAAVEDRKQSAMPAPDKLTLSKGEVAANSTAPDTLISKERERKDVDTRVAELSKNVDELKKLSGATAAVKESPALAPVSASAPEATSSLVVPIATVSESGAPSAPASAAAIADNAASVPVALQTPERGVVSALLDDNPLALGLGAGLVALLAGFGIYRYVKRGRKESGETSFLESRLQPDSFFGASGGQRIDTREVGGASSSSMSYSLSQLDAIGDVDPVAEADVYLAYGRDLQAEEILKEAMRSNPERMTIRTKLLEVYAKRRDTKGFELLAIQLRTLTHGEGEDWARAQELGSQIDPDNALYAPGGIPVDKSDAGELRGSLGASTMPQSIFPATSRFEEPPLAVHADATPGRGTDLDLDLDLDIGHADTVINTAPSPLEATQAFAPREAIDNGAMTLDFSTPELSLPRAEAPASRPAAQPLEFDLSGISLDLDVPATAGKVADLPESTNFGDTDLPLIDDDGSVDPFERKLELAEEFRQIGDMEGARDLLQEVVAKAGGALKAKAQVMLDELA